MLKGGAVSEEGLKELWDWYSRELERSMEEEYPHMVRYLMGKVGFSKVFAVAFAKRIASKEITMGNLARLAVARQKHVMIRYKDLGGIEEYPDFTASEIGKEAVLSADDDLTQLNNYKELQESGFTYALEYLDILNTPKLEVKIGVSR